MKPFTVSYSACCLATFEMMIVRDREGVERPETVCAECRRAAEKVKLEPDERRKRQFQRSQAHIAGALFLSTTALRFYREHNPERGQKLARLIYRLNDFTRPEWQARFELRETQSAASETPSKEDGAPVREDSPSPENAACGTLAKEPSQNVS